MLKIRFYNAQQKYVDQTEPFPNGQINRKLHDVRSHIGGINKITGWTVFELVGGCEFPYIPFNGCTPLK